MYSLRVNCLCRLFIFIAAALCCVSPASGHAPQADDDTPDTLKVERKPSCWTLISPLGLHKEAQFDTLPYNYQRQAVPSLVSDAYCTTGNLGGEGQNEIFFHRRKRSDFFFADALYAWMPHADAQKFYNVYIPFTQVSYNTGGSKQTAQDRLRIDFAANAGRRVGIGAKMDYLYSKGSYTGQSTKDFIFGFSGYYRGDRYQMQAYYNHWNLLNKENGGITDALYITDPAQLQGGVSKIEPRSIPVNLNAAHNRITGQHLYLNQAYNVGYWRDQVVNDTTTRQIYVPVTKFIWTLEYKSGRHLFLNTNPEEGAKFWANRYFDNDQTRDQTRYSDFTNTMGISMIEGFRKWAKFGLSAYATYSLRRFTQPDYPVPDQENPEESGFTPLPEGFIPRHKDSQNLLWAGAQLTKQRGSILTYEADFRMGLVGDVAADIDLTGRIDTRIPLFGDTVRVAAKGHFRNTAQPYLMQHYVSNHFIWNNDFGKTRSFRAEGEIEIPWTRTLVSAGFENIQNYVYFDSAGLPAQEGGSVQVFTASATQRLRFGIWNWDNRLTLQTTSKSEVLPLPTLAWYSNMYLHFRAFRVLDVQLGVDCDYYTRYYAPKYQPATMSFCVQQDTKIGNYPFMNVYATCKLYKVRFYVMWSHINQGWFSHDYFSSPLYPLNPRRFQIGLSVDFAN
ncbi:MAG: putative porin [Muribaculaceae bacterium]|nr:putative porin [Muribaculaceae bacterium]